MRGIQLKRRGGAAVWCVMGLFGYIVCADGATLARDASDDPAYSDAYPEWDSGDDGGFGFTPWTLSPDPNNADAGFFTASASQNAGVSGGAIDEGGDSWGLYASNGNSAVAYRGFDFDSDSALDGLAVGGTISLSMDNGWNDGNVGWILRSGNNTSGKNSGQRFEFIHQAGGNYLIIDSSGATDTGIGWTPNGLSFLFTLTGVDTYSIDVTPVGGSTSSFSGTLGGSSGGALESLALYNEGAGQGTEYDLFFNDIEVTDEDGPGSAVPEPGSLGLLTLGACLATILRRRLQGA